MAELAALGSPLLIRRGSTAQVLATLCRELGASGLDFTAPLDPLGRRRVQEVRVRLAGLECRPHPGVTLYDPKAIRNRSGEPFKVFTPFWKALNLYGDPPLPLDAPSRLVPPSIAVQGLELSELGLKPLKPDWAAGLRRTWVPGSRAGRERLASFLRGAIQRYATDRDFPVRSGTSTLSPYLATGEVSPGEVWHAVRNAQRAGVVSGESAEAWLRQLAWREFAWHLLDAFPHTLSQPLRPQFEAFPWRDDPDAFVAWTRGQTGYPIVDAGMRQLWETGWMPNRIRMIAASFLVKHLLIPWQWGARWFEDTLVDADLACNTFGWQWVAGSGADGVPYFRIFNPITQAETFDPDGEYIATWVPELAPLPPQLRHQPWRADPQEVGGYPPPIVAHAWARQRALHAFDEMKKTQKA